MTTAMNVTPQSGSTAWHAMATEEVLRRLDSIAQSGLEAAEVPRRLAQYGRNTLPEGRKQGPFMRFLMQLNNILVYVLLGAGFVKLMVGLWLDAAIILGVMLLNALLGFMQEGKAEKALDSIRNLLSGEARTVRGSQTRLIPAEELVPGDLVLLESGDRS
jgi:magnesium-transporting ATPase (P-type)